MLVFIILTDESGIWSIAVTTYFDTAFDVPGVYGITIAGATLEVPVTLTSSLNSATASLDVIDVSATYS